jgi:NAD-dependent SIR2 family protein deacetylase
LSIGRETREEENSEERVMTDPNLSGSGSGGHCICLKCGTKVAHQAGVPCKTTKCPACGATMLREGAAHHQAFLERQKAKKGR